MPVQIVLPEGERRSRETCRICHNKDIELEHIPNPNKEVKDDKPRKYSTRSFRKLVAEKLGRDVEETRKCHGIKGEEVKNIITAMYTTLRKNEKRLTSP